MKFPNLLKNTIDSSQMTDFERSRISDNIHRGKLLAIVVIGFEVVYSLLDISASLLKIDSRFEFSGYLAMYSAMILINAIFLLYFRNFENKTAFDDSRRKLFDIVIVIYVTLIMSWGSVVTLMDQKLYGQIVAFMVNMSICSAIFLMDHKKILIPYSISVLILAVGLPFYQKSGDILIGHSVNLLVFIFISWLTTRIIYGSYRQNFISRAALNEANSLLEKEIEENRKINIKLTLANDQLRELTLLDELTGIPNRRSFRDFIDRAFEKYVGEGSTLSIIMIDIDFFKQFNDYYGHEEGDRALCTIAGELYSLVEDAGEFVVRWGGEEFIYAAFNRSREAIAEKARIIGTMVSELRIAHNYSPVSSYITVSQGSSTIKTAAKKDINRAVKLADQALYMAKHSGRNCVKHLRDEPEE